ncbi:MAG: 6-phosphogluconolactonase, partial [Phycisphaerae bacterium]|nr:6-phosphogluconolactonase [Phycisphaerae bacterium]
LAERAVTDGVPWPKVQVFFGDEHDVSHDDIDSNYHMVQRTLLDHTPINWEHVHPMQGDAANLELVASEYEQTVRKLVKPGEDGIPQFDLIMLGMGGDGHTASLFPGHPVLDESKRLVVSCHIPVLGRNRITFTYPLINAAQNILLLVTGDDKAEVVKRVFQNSDQSLPSARVAPKHGTFHIVLDVAAARLL